MNGKLLKVWSLVLSVVDIFIQFNNTCLRKAFQTFVNIVSIYFHNVPASNIIVKSQYLKQPHVYYTWECLK